MTSLDVWDTGETGAQNPEEFFSAGVFLLKRGKPKEANLAFRHALQLKQNEPKYQSYLGLSLALSDGRYKEAVTLCEGAVKKEFYKPELFLNLGRVYLLAGNRRKGHMALRKGLALDRDNKDIKQELERMGVRKSAVFPFLDRQHPFNRIAGKALYKVGLR